MRKLLLLVSKEKKIHSLCSLSYLDENISHLPSVSRLLLFQANQDLILRFLIDSRKLHVFSYLSMIFN